MKSRAIILFVAAVTLRAVAATYYVSDATGVDAKGGGRSWGKAFKTLGFAVDIAPSGSTIIVTNGIYAPFVSNNKKLDIRSVEGASATAIENPPKPGSSVIFVDETILADMGKWGEEKVYDYDDNGKRYWTGEWQWSLKGGSSTKLSGFSLRNAAVAAAGGTLSHCVVSNMSQRVAAMSVLKDCSIVSNSCDASGSPDGEFAMLRKCTLERCRVIDNKVVQGLWDCTLTCSLVADNKQQWTVRDDHNDWDCYYGNLIEGGFLYNCTIAGNVLKEQEQFRIFKQSETVSVWVSTGQFRYGAAVAAANCYNSIIWNNATDRTGTVSDLAQMQGKTVKYCSETQNPLVRDASSGDWRLFPWSKCRDAGGDYRKKTGNYDIDGRPRKIGSSVDIGAFEHPQGIAVQADWDGDGVADCATYCPDTFEWCVWESSTGDVRVETFGEKGAVPVPADWDGDGLLEPGYFTAAATKPEFVRRDSTGNIVRTRLGAKASTPLVFSRPGTAEPVFGAWSGTSVSPMLVTSDGSPQLKFGKKGAKALTADFDGDGLLDFAVYTATATKPAFSVVSSSSGYSTAKLFPSGKPVALGVKGSQPVVCDWDGDGKADFGAYSSSAKTPVFYRLSSGTLWRETRSFPFGAKGWTSVSADWNGDGAADPAVFDGKNWSWVDSSWEVFTVLF